MKNIFLYLILVSTLMSGCRKEKDVKSTEELQEAIKNGRDTTLVDENGGKVEIHINNAKIIEIDNSINGAVRYSLATHDGRVMNDIYGNIAKTVFKSEYKNDTLSIGISDDSLFVGEIFTGRIFAHHKNYTIKIIEPQNLIVNTDFDEPYKFNFNCDKEGEYKFIGEILFDSNSPFPFEYKFIVVAKKTQ